MFVCILLLFDQSIKNLIIGSFDTSADKSFDLNLAILRTRPPTDRERVDYTTETRKGRNCGEARTRRGRWRKRRKLGHQHP